MVLVILFPPLPTSEHEAKERKRKRGRKRERESGITSLSRGDLADVIGEEKSEKENRNWALFFFSLFFLRLLRLSIVCCVLLKME